MATKLERFKVYNFRSIEESDWIEVSDNNCLVGTNEAGKTNLLIALWKLNPANKEPIVPLDDFPRHLYSNYKAGNHSEDVFIAADFILDTEFRNGIGSELQCDLEQISRVLVKRKYNGKYEVSFPYSKIDTYPVDRLLEIILKFEERLYADEVFTKETSELKQSIQHFLANSKDNLPDTYFTISDIGNIITFTQAFVEKNFGKKKNLPELFNTELIEKLEKFNDAFQGKPIATTAELNAKV